LPVSRYDDVKAFTVEANAQRVDEGLFVLDEQDIGSNHDFGV
jgi:hypothetical protein